MSTNPVTADSKKGPVRVASEIVRVQMMFQVLRDRLRASSPLSAVFRATEFNTRSATWPVLDNGPACGDRAPRRCGAVDAAAKVNI